MENKKLKVCWLSAGVSSFIAGYLEKDTIDEYIYIDIADQHPDSMRFIKDCEKVLGKKTTILKSLEYKDVDDVFRKKGATHIIKTGYAPCTNLLKKEVRNKWQQEHAEYDITYVWGFDLKEKHRAENMIKNHPEYKHEFPLIEKELSKEEVHGMLKILGIKRPVMYDLGYNNNNCVGCIKGGMGYWNKIRVDFPEVFAKRAKLERELGMSILKQCYLDELEPNRGRIKYANEECNIFCYINLQEGGKQNDNKRIKN